MERLLFSIAIVIACGFYGSTATAQTTPSQELPKYELAADFSSLSLDSGTSLPGVGGRFTYNLNEHFALEAAGFFFPGKCQFCNGERTGRVVQGLFGVKAGKRFGKWGIFGKARPGFATFSRAGFSVTPVSSNVISGLNVSCFGLNPTNPQPCFQINQDRLTAAAFDIGGALEFYPSRKLVVRLDAGDTILHYPRRTFNTLVADPNNPFVPMIAPFTTAARTRHSFQFIGGVGFRF